MGRKQKSKAGGIVMGITLVVLSMVALWKNETRYNYFRSAQSTVPLESLADALPGQLFSYTGKPDAQLTLKGHYAQQFTGYLGVWAKTEIYSWTEDTDEDGHTSYRKGWHHSVESNSRNSGVKKLLANQIWLPPKYEISELTVLSKQIQFVDPANTIPVSSLTISPTGLELGLRKDEPYLYRSRSRSISRDPRIGDERVKYRGITVPVEATYFGKHNNGQGVAETKDMRTGWINKIIQDSGILHHLVAGDRTTALSSIQRHMDRLKWLIRGIGTATICGGFICFFSVFARLFFNLPILGELAEKGAILLGTAIGIPVALLTIITSYLFAHPLLLIGFMSLIVGIVYRLRKRGFSQQASLKSAVDKIYGHRLSELELKEKQFVELVHLAKSGEGLTKAETEFLWQWGKKQKWSRDQCNQLIEKATAFRDVGVDNLTTEEHLLQLIKLAMADGYVSALELRSIRHVAKQAGYDRTGIQKIIDHVRKIAKTDP
ncbi:MAG: TMEM43 family protein [Planctomycetota bacterium]|nr:TMEM43 family protein [Planctomycetota bacterium]